MVTKTDFINNIRGLKKDENYIAAECFVSMDSSHGHLNISFDFDKDYSDFMDTNKSELIELCKRCIPYSGYSDSLGGSDKVRFMQLQFFNKGKDDLFARIYLDVYTEIFSQSPLSIETTEYLKRTTKELKSIHLSNNHATINSEYITDYPTTFIN